MILAILAVFATMSPLCADGDRERGCRVASTPQHSSAHADAVQLSGARSAPRTRY